MMGNFVYICSTHGVDPWSIYPLIVLAVEKGIEINTSLLHLVELKYDVIHLRIFASSFPQYPGERCFFVNENQTGSKWPTAN